MKFRWAEMYLLSGFKEWTRVDPSKSNLFSHTFIKAYLKRFLYIVKDNMVRVEVSCVYNDVDLLRKRRAFQESVNKHP